MSRPMQQPVGQVRLTNVAIVRYKRAGMRFEVAAYKNKVLNWRNKIETDINEVLQTHTVFMNVSRGVAAKAADLKEAFGTEDQLKCAILILEKGELEVSEKERQLQLDTLFRDIATIISEKCVNPETARPYTLSLIERALKDIHFSVVAGKPAKAQALRAIALLKEHLPLERAKMKLRLTVPAGNMGGEEGVRVWLTSMSAVVEREDKGSASSGSGSGSGSDLITMDVVVDPGHFRGIEEDIKRRTSGRGAAEVLSLSASGDLGGERGGAGGAGGAGDEEEEDGSGTAASASSAAADGDGDVDGASAAMRRMALSSSRVGGGAAAEGSGGAASASASSGGAGGGGAGSADVTAASARGTGMLVRRVVQPTAGRKLTCTACGLTFEEATSHREHQRADLHRFNLKRKVKMMEPVTQEQMDAMPAKERQAFLDADL